MRRILPVVLCLAVCLGLLAGCAGKTEPDNDPQAAADAEKHEPDAVMDDVSSAPVIDDWNGNAAAITQNLNDLGNPEGGIYILSAAYEELGPKVVGYGSEDMIVTPAK